MEKSRKPKIRFKGFTDDWEQRKLGDIGQTYTGLSGKTKDDFGHGQAQFVTYMNVFSNPISNPKMNEPIEVDSNQNEVEVGDVFFTTSSETPKEVGMTSVLIEKQGKVYLNSFCFGYRLYEKYDSYYLAYMLRSNSFREKIIMLAQGISRYNISKNKVMEIDVFIPSYKEQMEIGKYFRDLDTLITLHQRKLDKLINVKKSMLEKMFPKQGSTVPEIRFNGFTQAWEQCKFRELYSKSGEKNDGSIGINKNITVATMQFKGDVNVSTPEYLKTYYTFNLGDIAFEGHQSKEFRYGRFVENDIGNGIVSHIFSVFRPVQEYDLHFWKYAINNEELMQHILSRSTKASTMMHDLVTDDFLNETFLVPSLSEQEKVGSILHNLDNLITLHQRVKLLKIDIITKKGVLNNGI